LRVAIEIVESVEVLARVVGLVDVGEGRAGFGPGSDISPIALAVRAGGVGKIIGAGTKNQLLLTDVDRANDSANTPPMDYFIATASAGISVAGRRVQATCSPDQWIDITNWPVNTGLRSSPIGNRIPNQEKNNTAASW